jgi:hypothetical protein
MTSGRKRPNLLPDTPLAEAYGYDPKLVVAGHGDESLGQLFIVMAVVYNDLKGASLLAHYIKPILDKTNPVDRAFVTYGEAAVGEVAGVSQQIGRLFAGILRELMVVLGAHAKTIEEDRFQRLLRGMPPGPKAAWNRIWRVATEQDAAATVPRAARPTPKTDADSHLLVLLRNNVAFHYGPKSLANGYRAFFFEDPASALNSLAVFSDGADMSATRFHFGDAAVTGAVAKLFGTDAGMVHERVARIASDVNIALRFLILRYLGKHCGQKRHFHVPST